MPVIEYSETNFYVTFEKYLLKEIRFSNREVLPKLVNFYQSTSLMNIFGLQYTFLIWVVVWRVTSTACFSGPYFPTFGLNTERYLVSLRIQSECGKMRTTKLRIQTLFTQCKKGRFLGAGEVS